MSAKKLSNAKRLLAIATGLLPVLALGACSDYLQHSDTVTSAAGDAQAFNKTIHIADPWPRAAANTRITGNGQRVDNVMERYLSGGVAPASPEPTFTNQSSGSSKSPNSGNSQ